MLEHKLYIGSLENERIELRDYRGVGRRAVKILRIMINVLTS